MAYRKVSDSQGGRLVGEPCPGALELDWDLDKEELPAAGPDLERRPTQQLDQREDPGPDPDPDQPSVSVSPHGRFERLQEDPNYISHFTRTQGHKGQRGQSFVLLRYLVVGGAPFVLGVLIGWFLHSPSSVKPKALVSESPDLLEELLTRISADKIKALQWSVFRQPDSEASRARFLFRQWVELGLTDVQLSNHTIQLTVPGPAQNTIEDQQSRKCYLPSGDSCGQDRAESLTNQHLPYAEYSAAGTVQGEVVDVQYGALEDLQKLQQSRNLSGHIAVLKLGHIPLLYKLSLLSELGFAAVLLYVDPCDAPQGQSEWSQVFSVTLDPGGNTPDPWGDRPDLGGNTPDPEGHRHRTVSPGKESTCGGSSAPLSSLLVQPVSPLMAQTLLSAEVKGHAEACTITAMPSNTEPKTISLSVGNQRINRTIYNVVGFLKGKKDPDRYVLVGGHHGTQRGGGASAIMTELIAAFTEQTKTGWTPDRTVVFCSWGGSSLGNIGSTLWGTENRVVLQSSAVAYISLDSPVRGTETLTATASPSLLQLTSDIHKRQLLSCIREGNCPGPNVSSLQTPGDSAFFSNVLATPTLQFSFQQTTDEQVSSLLSEAQFPVDSPQTLDPLFKFHETIAKMTAEAVFRLVNDPVLPFNTLDIVLDVQNKLRDKSSLPPALLAAASSLRDRVAFFQSEVMRPANDPKERDPAHVRMLNDVLRDVEKSFILSDAPPGIYRNLLYSLPGAQHQFSILRLAEDSALFCDGTRRPGVPTADQEASGPGPGDQSCSGPRRRALDAIIAAIRSAEKLICFGLELFENYPSDVK